VVSKEDLIAHVWNGRIVSESTLSSRITAARQVIGDSGENQRLIRTIARKGIRFIGEVCEVGKPLDTAKAGAIQAEAAVAALPLTGRTSVAVLPFDALGGDAELESFVDGLTEDIITGLSRIRALWVIARNTMFTYKGRPTDVRAVGKELGVQYVVNGSVRKAGGRLRMSAQLIEAETGHHIWAANFDRPNAGLFELQDDFAHSVVASVQVQLIVSEGKAVAGKARLSAQVGDLLARARERAYQLTPEGLKELVSLTERALEIDPANGEACRLQAAGIWHQAYRGFIPWDQATADRVMVLAQRAVSAEEVDEYAHWMMALAYLMACKHDRSVTSLRHALDINPSFSLGYGTLGTVLAWAGKSEESIANNELALRINPGDPLNPHRYFGLALAHYLATRYSKAVEYAAEVVQLRPDWWLGLIIYVASLAKVDSMAEARAACTDLRAAKPDMTVATLHSLPFANASDRDHVAEGLVKAGLSKG